MSELKEKWTSSFSAEIHTRIWDRAATDYLDKPLPSLEEDPFLRRMRQRGALERDYTVLDIGCGAGAYSLAIAPHVKRAVGCDLSPRMISGAKERAAELNEDNTEFTTLDWHAFDLAASGWEKGFDVVFAHMTPAIGSYATFDKMVRCARKSCFFQKNTRRHDEVLDAALALIGITDPRGGQDDVVYCFQYLWENGYEPHMDYYPEVWHSVRSTEDAVGWCVDRAKLRREITPGEEQCIREYVTSLAVEDMVHEVTTTTIVTMDWDI